MASNETILLWKAQLVGADSVKDGLNKINDAVSRGSLTQTEANKVIQSATKDTRNLRAEQNLINRSFMSAHPQIAQLTRSMSTLSHIARTGLNIANSLNIMWIRQAETLRTSSELSYNAAIAQREYTQAVAKFGPDSREAREALEKLNIEKGKLADFKISSITQGFFDIGVILSSVGTFAATTFVALSKYPGLLSRLIPMVRLLANPFTAIAVAVAFAAEEMYKFLFNVSDMDKWREKNVAALFQFFTQDIPIALGQAGVALTQFFLTDLPNWAGIGLNSLKTLFVNTWNGIISTTNFGVNAVISGVNSVINGAITAINAFISAINNILKKAKLGTISLIPKFQGIPPINIPMIAAAKGFNGMVNSPTFFMTGEGNRPEHVSITPGGSSGGSGISVIVNVQGSILTERELFRRVDENLKNELRKRNYRILQ